MDSMLPILLVAASSGSNRRDVAETVIFSSNLIPETPRTVLAFTAAQDRDRDQRRNAEDLASALIEKKVTFTQDELNRHPRLEKQIKLLPENTRSQIVVGLTEPPTSARKGSTS